MSRWWIGFVLLWWGCSAPNAPQPVPLGGGGHLELMPPSSYGGSLEVQQKLTLHQADETRQLVVLLSIDPQRLSLTGLGPMGAPLVEVEWGPQGLSQHALVPLGVEGRFILADLQLALWPRISGLRGLTLEEGADFRRLIGPEGVVMEVRYHPDRDRARRWEIEHFLRDYRIVIEALD